MAPSGSRRAEAALRIGWWCGERASTATATVTSVPRRSTKLSLDSGVHEAATLRAREGGDDEAEGGGDIVSSGGRRRKRSSSACDVSSASARSRWNSRPSGVALLAITTCSSTCGRGRVVLGSLSDCPNDRTVASSTSASSVAVGKASSTGDSRRGALRRGDGRRVAARRGGGRLAGARGISSTSHRVLHEVEQ